MITVERYHDFSAGHRVVGHEGKCAKLHGHNYRVTFVVAPIVADMTDEIGRVADFGVVKSALCQWLEDNWDHKMLLWDEDPLFHVTMSSMDEYALGVVRVPFNPTAENMARYLVDYVGPVRLRADAVRLVLCKVEETRKCSATYSVKDFG